MYNRKKGAMERRALILIGMISVIFAANTRLIPAQEAPIVPQQNASEITVTCYATAQLLRSLPDLKEGALV